MTLDSAVYFKNVLLGAIIDFWITDKSLEPFLIHFQRELLEQRRNEKTFTCKQKKLSLAEFLPICIFLCSMENWLDLSERKQNILELNRQPSFKS